MNVARLLMSGILMVHCMAVYAMQVQEHDTQKRILFLSMDVSNLDPREGKILALAALLTDEKLNVCSELYEVIGHPYEVVVSIDPYLKPKYLESGLRQQVLNSEVSMKQVNDKLAGILSNIPNTCGMAWLVGGNVINLYREFLKEKLPEVNRLISYRKPIHIPTLRASALLFNEDDTFECAQQNEKGELKVPKNSLEEVRSLLDEYKYYRTRYFNSSPEQTFHDVDLK